MKKHSKKVKIAAGLLLLILLTFITLLAYEIKYRLHGDYPVSVISFDKKLIFRLTSDLKKVETKHGQTFPVRFNNHGFRGAYFPTNKEATTKRILMLGDSFVAGFDFAEEKIFTSIFAENNKDYEVLNISCPAWSTDQQYLLMQDEGLSYQPDHVILVISPNDMREAYNKKLIQLSENDELAISPAWFPRKQRLGWWLSNRFSLFQYLQKKKFHTDYGTYFHIFRSYPVNFGKEEEGNWNFPVFLKKPFEEVQAAQKLHEKLIKEIIELCKQNDINILLAVNAGKENFDGSLTTEKYERGKVTNYVDSLAQAENIPFLNILNAFQDLENPMNYYIPGDFHYNEKGHEVVGALLTNFFKENEKK